MTSKFWISLVVLVLFMFWLGSDVANQNWFFVIVELFVVSYYGVMLWNESTKRKEIADG